MMVNHKESNIILNLPNFAVLDQVQMQIKRIRKKQTNKQREETTK